MQASANERTSSDWLPVRPPVATGASHVTPSPARAARGAASGVFEPVCCATSVGKIPRMYSISHHFISYVIPSPAAATFIPNVV